MKQYGEFTELTDIQFRQSTGGAVKVQSSSTRTAGTQTINCPDLGADTISDTLVTLAATQTISGAKTFTGTHTVTAGNVSFKDQTDPTKQMFFDSSALATATTATLKLAGNLTTAGNNSLTLTTTGSTSVTLPTSGTLMTNPMTTAGDVIYGGASGVPTRLAAGTSVQVLHGGTTPTWSAVSLTADVSGILPIANGGTAVSSVTVAPAATAFAGWDANKNLSANSHITGYTTTATAAGTTTLVVGSTQQQYFTGSTTQTVLLPVVSTLVLGQTFTVVNNSTGVVTVQSSGANTILAMSGLTIATYTVILITGTGTASWSVSASAGQLQGSATNDNASAGNVGEIIRGSLASASQVTLTTATASNVFSNGSGTGGGAVTLTPGDWDLHGMLHFSGNASTVISFIQGSYSKTSAQISGGVGQPVSAELNMISRGFIGTAVNLEFDMVFPVYRVSVSTSTAIYLCAQGNFTAGSLAVNGFLEARRIR